MAQIPIPDSVQQKASGQNFGEVQWIQMSRSRLHGFNNFLYTGGIVQMSTLRGKIQTFPWEDVETARHGQTVHLEYRQDTGSVTHRINDRYEVGFKNHARPVSFFIGREPDNTRAIDYFNSGLRQPTTFNRHAQEARAWVNKKLGWAQAGQTKTNQ